MVTWAGTRALCLFVKLVRKKRSVEYLQRGRQGAGSITTCSQPFCEAARTAGFAHVRTDTPEAKELAQARWTRK